MKITLYENRPIDGEQPLEDALNGCTGRPLGDRESGPDDRRIFLETCTQTRQGWYKMDFTLRRREHGPGLSKPGQATRDFSLNPDEGFGEQTAAVYAPEHNLVAVQYNHYGPKAGRIAGYLNEFSQEDSRFNWDPILDQDAEARLARAGIEKRLQVTIATRGLTDEGYANNVALGSILDMRDQTNAGMVNLTLSLGRGERGQSLTLAEYIKSFLIAGEVGGDVVKKLAVEIVNEDESVELLDFLGCKVVAEIDNNNLNITPGRRYTFESRATAIARQLRAWAQQY